MKNKSQVLRLFFVFFISIIFLVNFYLFYKFLEITQVETLRGFNEYGDDFYIMKTSFNTVYAVSLVFPALYGLLYETKGRMLKCLILAIIILFTLFLLRAQFTTAILVAIIGLYSEILYRHKFNVFRSLILSLIIGGVALFTIIPIAINVLNDSGEYKTVAARLTEINDVVTGNKNNASDINERSSLSSRSLLTFIENPVLGINYKINDKRDVNDQGLGNHAAWVDFLAKFGLSSVFIFYFLFISLKRQKMGIGSPATMITFILLGFLNPLFLFPQMFVTFLFNPLLYGLVKK